MSTPPEYAEPSPRAGSRLLTHSYPQARDRASGEENRCAAQGGHASGRDTVTPQTLDQTNRVHNWSGAPFYKQATLSAAFLTIFLLLDASSTASLKWEGAPSWYLPAGLSAALLLAGGLRYAPVVFV